MEMKQIKSLVILITFLASSVNAEEQKQVFGDWVVGGYIDAQQGFSYAKTTNESGSTLGILCLSATDSCVPYIINGLTCEEGAKYPALVAIDDGVTTVKMGCVHIQDRHMFTLPVEHAEYMVTKNKYSVAYGTDGGKFRAAYFSLNGSAKAAIAAKQLIDKEKTTHESDADKSNSKYKDTYL